MEWIQPAIVVMSLLCLTGGDVCLRKYNKSSGICEGVMRGKYTNISTCCARHNAAGFAQASWRRGHNRFLCIPCIAKKPHNHGLEDGKWSDWTPWKPCSVSCGKGIQARYRQCTGTKKCPGFSNEQRACNLSPCPVHGGWSEFGPYSQCSVTCGTGQRVRQRLCDNPPPLNGGNDCEGLSLEVESCDKGQCPIDGGWSVWTVWAACSTTCGTGFQQRLRDCNSPIPQYGGKPCKGEIRESKECVQPVPCPVDGGWSKWLEFGPCKAVDCIFGKGYWVRSRTCTNPRPENGGQMCQGSYYDSQPCKNPVNCKSFSVVDLKEEGSGSGCINSYGSGMGSGDGSSIDCDQENDEALLDENFITNH